MDEVGRGGRLRARAAAMGAALGKVCGPDDGKSHEDHASALVERERCGSKERLRSNAVTTIGCGGPLSLRGRCPFLLSLSEALLWGILIQ